MSASIRADYQAKYLRTFVVDSTEAMDATIPSDTVFVWLAPNKVSYRFRTNHSIVRFDQQRVFLVYDKSHSYIDLPLAPAHELGRVAARLAAEFPDKAETFVAALSDVTREPYLDVERALRDRPTFLQQVRNAALIASCLPVARRDSSEAEAEVTGTDRSRTIGGRSCRAYEIKLLLGAGGRIEGTAWLDTAQSLQYRTFRIAESGDAIAHPAVTWALTGLPPIHGLAVKTEVVLIMPERLPIHIVDSLVSLEETAPPDGTYDVPNDYKLLPIFTLSVYREMLKVVRGKSKRQ